MQRRKPAVKYKVLTYLFSVTNSVMIRYCEDIISQNGTVVTDYCPHYFLIWQILVTKNWQAQACCPYEYHIVYCSYAKVKLVLW